MTRVYHRPIVSAEPLRPREALPLAGGALWFSDVSLHERERAPQLVPAADLDPSVRARLTARRAPVCGLAMDRPRIMGILNVTPDSFSDGGRFLAQEAAVAQAHALVAAGADILDIGGESTRPGSDPVPVEEELSRVVPVIERIRAAGLTVPISIDTRKAAVARAALDAGAALVNDVSALTFDPHIAGVAAGAEAVCLMHARGDPKTMQDAPAYDDVLLDVADYLEARVAAAEAAGVPRERILVDPGIGFGKTVDHNLALVRGLAVFHDLGCPILFGASRKRFIGTIANVPEAERRNSGSITVALEALRHGAQVIRVHDVAETRQALALWWALVGPGHLG